MAIDDHRDVAILASPGGLTPRLAGSVASRTERIVAILASPGGLTPRHATPGGGPRSRTRCDPRQPRRADATHIGVTLDDADDRELRSSPAPEG